MIVVLVIVNCSLLATTINTHAIALVNTEIVLQSPLYTEDDKTTSHGSANGVNYTDMGEALITPGGSDGK